MTTDAGYGARVLRVEVAEGLRAILREPTALFFSVLPTGADATGDVVALLVTTPIGGLLAGWAYRNLRL